MMPVPPSVRDVVDHRLRALSAVAQSVALTAAVLGRGATDTDLLYASEDSSVDAARLGLDELLRRHVLEPAEPGRLRFCHDKLRERTYSQAPVETRRHLHRRVADLIEAQAIKIDDVAATLGHHFRVAEVPEEGPVL